jgi:glutaredoxin
MNKILLSILLICLSAFLIFFLIFNQKESEVKIESNIIIFYSEYCAHCLAVKEYIKENKIEEKISFETKDTGESTDLLFEKADICGIEPNQVGVPFLFDGEKCLFGDKDIIDFFELQIR